MNIRAFFGGFIIMTLVFLVITLLLLSNPLGFALLNQALTLLASLGISFISLFILSYIIAVIVYYSTPPLSTAILYVISFLLFLLFIYGIYLFNKYLNQPGGNFTLFVKNIFDWIFFFIATLLVLNIPNIILVLIGYIGASMLIFAPGTLTTPSVNEIRWRSYLVGLNSSMNLLLTLLTYKIIFSFFLPPHISIIVTIILAVFLMIVNYRAVDHSFNPTYKSILGISCIVMPMAWLANMIGLLLFVISLTFHILSLIPSLRVFKIGRFHLIRETWAIVTYGGICGNLQMGSCGYNLGNFTFLMFPMPVSGCEPDDNIYLHEDGHHLSLGAFGSNFHFIGFVNEVPRLFGHLLLSILKILRREIYHLP
jgi:hypothetical protein